MPRKPLGPDEPFAKALIFKSQWEQHYEGETYIITGKDLKFAKELAEIDNDEIIRRLGAYFTDPWYAEHCRHALAPFVSNINKFVPQQKPVSVKRNQPERLMIDCSSCGTKHPANEKCPLSEEAQKLTSIDIENTLTLLSKKKMDTPR